MRRTDAGRVIAPDNVTPRSMATNACIGQWSLHRYVVFLFMIERRVGKAVVDAAIIGQQKQSGGILVQPAHRKKALRQVHQIRHHRLALVFAAGHHPFRLVEHDIDVPITPAHRHTLELHHIAFGIHFGSESGHHLAVDGHLTGQDVSLPFSPGAGPDSEKEIFAGESSAWLGVAAFHHDR
jgi:hypothetical protein